ncbi:MAG: hypothetical protein WC623_22260 [Pedobacter sp.]|uniref:hypothetical protein n=1 Tax=Pedobacter sp. TaxID=1411316 RepID=UPI003568001B
MTKIIIIDKCSHCPYRKTTGKKFFGKNIHYVCLNSTTTYTFDPESQPREIVDINTIPEWCRLKEAIPNLRGLQHEYDIKEMMKKYLGEKNETVGRI